MKYLIVLLFMIFPGMESYCQWSEITPFGGIAVDGAFSFVINGKAYVGGGPNVKSFYQYDPGTNKWTRMADVGGGPRGGAFAFSINGLGYVGGGDPNGSETNFLNDVWQYDPGTNKWTQKTIFPGDARNAAFTFVVGSKAYMGGGYNSHALSDFWEYDPSTDMWTKLGFYTGGLIEYAASFVIDGAPYVCGGGLPYCYKYDVVANTWQKKADFPGIHRQSSIGFGLNGKGFVGMGDTSDFSKAYQDFYEYDPVKDSWTKRADLTYPIPNSAWSTGFLIGNDIYAGTGASLPGLILTNRFFKINLNIRLNKTLLDFHNVGVGTNSVMPVTIKNTGDTNLHITGILINDANAVYSLVNFPGTLIIKPNDSADVNVQFSPKAIKTYSANLIINPGATNGDSLTVNLTGSGGIKKPQIKLSLKDMNFGTVKLGIAKDSTFTVTNIGDTTLTITYLTIANDLSNVFSTDLIGILKIEPDSSITYDIKFVPKEAAHYTAKLAVGSNDSSNLQLIITLSGDGEAGQSVGIEPENTAILNIIPNPVTSNSVIIINQAIPTNIDLDIYNLSGMKVQNILNNNFVQEGLKTINLNSNNLPCGTYILKLKTESKIYTKKFIVQ